jgi:hypothetical protein
VGEGVDLKLQPYRQLSATGITHSKINSCFCEPFEVMGNIKTTIYKLNLSLRSQTHLVFPVSQVNSRISRGVTVEPTISVVGPEIGLRLVPAVILARKIIKLRKEPVMQVWNKWLNTSKEESAWKNYDYMAKNYPELIFRDEDILKGSGVSAAESEPKEVPSAQLSG